MVHSGAFILTHDNVANYICVNKYFNLILEVFFGQFLGS